MDRYQLITIYRCDLLNPLKKVVSRKFKENSESLRGQLDRASDISRKKKQNFAGFSGANSRKNWPISREILGGNFTMKQSVKNSRFRWIFFGKFPYLPTSGDLKSGDSLFCPAPTNCLRTLYDVLHEVYGIKMRFHHCNDKLIFVID